MIVNHSDIKIALYLRHKSLNYNVCYVSLCFPINLVLLFNIKLTNDIIMLVLTVTGQTNSFFNNTKQTRPVVYFHKILIVAS